jgi:hypothetical protein
MEELCLRTPTCIHSAVIETSPYPDVSRALHTSCQWVAGPCFCPFALHLVGFRSARFQANFTTQVYA